MTGSRKNRQVSSYQPLVYHQPQPYYVLPYMVAIELVSSPQPAPA